MNSPRKVLLFGRTLLIEGVNASLHPTDGLEIERIEGNLDNLAGQLQMMCPDVVIFDLVAIRVQQVVAVMQACPQVRLIGLDPQHNTAIELSSQVHVTRSTNDLTQIIRGE